MSRAPHLLTRSLPHSFFQPHPSSSPSIYRGAPCATGPTSTRLTHRNLPPCLEGPGTTEADEGIVQTHSHKPRISVGVSGPMRGPVWESQGGGAELNAKCEPAQPRERRVSLGGGRVEGDKGVCGSEGKAASLQISESDRVRTNPSRHREAHPS